MQRPPTHRFFAYALILTLVGSLFSLVLPAAPSYASHENITVNISGDEVTETYGENDEVAIEGVIEDVVDGEEVIISVGEPGDSSPDEIDSMEPSSNGIFDTIYEVPNNPDDGVYTVEVEYDGESVFSYFIVDEDDDTITVVVDNNDGIYEAGDDVIISGQVENEDIGNEPEVLITVLDPTNDAIYDEEQVELGEGSLSDDEFEFEFSLENDASHGRYAVIVTYDFEDQEGSTLFEIEDTDTGGGGGSGCEGGDTDDDGDLSAEMGADSYEPGDTVCLSGTIDGYDSGDNEDLEIVVQDPDDEEVDDYGENNADVESDGDFEYEFDLDDNAAGGTYTVTLTYIGDEVQLTFDVEEPAGSGGGDDVTDGITDGDLTAKLNKASYLAGETMTVSGEVDQLKEDENDDPERVFVLLYRPTGVVILQASENAEPSSDGSFSINVVLDTDYDLDVDDDYRVTVAYVDDEVDLHFDITGVSSTPSNEISVQTDKGEYEIGDTVEISGEVPDALIVSGQQLLIKVDKPDGNPCRIDPISVPSSGSFTYDLVLGGVCGVAGEYDVQVTYGDEEASTSFELIGSSASEYNLNVEGDSYPIEYELSSGAINSMFVRPTEDKLVITLDAEEDGQLTVVLPREVIDAIEDGEDIDFVVTAEDEQGNVSVVDFEESENTDDERTIVIDYQAGTGRIEIAGTQVVPEFGAIAAIVMAVAIVGTIVATTRYSKFFRQ